MKKILTLVIIIISFISGILITYFVANSKTKLEIFNFETNQNIEIGKIKTKDYSKNGYGFDCIPVDEDAFLEIIDNYFLDCHKEDFILYYLDYYKSGTLYFKDNNCYFLYKESNAYKMINFCSVFYLENSNKEFIAIIPSLSINHVDNSTINILEEELFKYTFEELKIIYEKLDFCATIQEDSNKILIKGFNKEKSTYTSNYILEIDYLNNSVILRDN